MSTIPSSVGRPDDGHGEEGARPAKKRIVGSWALRVLVPQADLGPAVADPADAALWDGCHARLPRGVHADAHIVDEARSQARKMGPTSRSCTIWRRFQGCDVIYAKSWGPLMTHRRSSRRKKLQDKYQDGSRMWPRGRSAAPDASTWHPLPADRDIEVTNEGDGWPAFVVFDQAENRLHAQRR